MNGLCSPRVGMMIQSDELHHFSGGRSMVNHQIDYIYIYIGD